MVIRNITIYVSDNHFGFLAIWVKPFPISIKFDGTTIFPFTSHVKKHPIYNSCGYKINAIPIHKLIFTAHLLVAFIKPCKVSNTFFNWLSNNKAHEGIHAPAPRFSKCTKCGDFSIDPYIHGLVGYLPWLRLYYGVTGLKIPIIC